MYVAPYYGSQVSTPFVAQPPPVGAENYRSMAEVEIDLDHILFVQED